MAKHRTYSIDFKRQVSQEYLSGETLHGLSKRHDISRNLIRIWIDKYQAGALDEDAAAADLLQTYEARIAALEHWRSAEHVHFDERERAVLTYVDAVSEPGAGLETARKLVDAHLDREQVAGLTMMIGFYQMTGQFAEAMAVEPEEPFVGWDLF